MKKSLMAIVAASALAFAACGSDSGGTSGAQAEAADAAIAAADEAGITLDKDCVDDLASQLSDEDAAAIAAAGPDGDADLSVEGEAIGTKLLTCADKGEIVDAFIAEMKGSGQEFDEECVRKGLDGVDLTSLAASEGSGSEAPEELVKAVFDCFELGS